MRCNAAAKGIQGDGKVTLCVSKEQFDGIVDKAGDSLVRLPSLSSKSNHDSRARKKKRGLFVIKPKPTDPSSLPTTEDTHLT